jgi:hypothetical protein
MLFCATGKLFTERFEAPGQSPAGAKNAVNELGTGRVGGGIEVSGVDFLKAVLSWFVIVYNA